MGWWSTHRLDGERHARLHRAHGLVFGVVRHVRRGVEKVVHTMAGVRPHDGAAILTRDWLAARVVQRSKQFCWSLRVANSLT